MTGQLRSANFEAFHDLVKDYLTNNSDDSASAIKVAVSSILKTSVLYKLTDF